MGTLMQTKDIFEIEMFEGVNVDDCRHPLLTCLKMFRLVSFHYLPAFSNYCHHPINLAKPKIILRTRYFRFVFVSVRFASFRFLFRVWFRNPAFFSISTDRPSTAL